MHQRQVFTAVQKEADDSVDILDGYACCRRHDRLVGLDYAFQKRPVGEGAAGNLDDLESMLLYRIYGGLIEWRTDWNETKGDRFRMKP